MKETSIELTKAIIRFVEDAHHKMIFDGYRTEHLRIAFPKYLESYFFEGMYHLGYGPPHNQELNQMNGIKVHPTWENALTLYYVNYPQTVFDDIPVYKLNFETESKEYALGKKLITDIKKTYSYKL